MLAPVWTSKIRAVGRAWGVKPDTFVLSWDTFLNLIDNAAILDRITGGATVANPADIDLALLSKLFRIPQVLVGEAVVQTQAVPILDPGDRTKTLDTWYEVSLERVVGGTGELVDELRFALAIDKTVPGPSSQ